MTYQEYENILKHIIDNYIDGFWTEDEAVRAIYQHANASQENMARFIFLTLMKKKK